MCACSLPGTISSNLLVQCADKELPGLTLLRTGSKAQSIVANCLADMPEGQGLLPRLSFSVYSAAPIRGHESALPSPSYNYT